MECGGVSQEAVLVKQESEWGHDEKDPLGAPCDVVLTGNKSNQPSGATQVPALEHISSGEQLEFIPHELSNTRHTTHQRATVTNTQDTDNEDYNCDTCGRTFPQRSDLIHHIQKAITECVPIENKISSERHEPAGNKAFWCDICQKQFRDSSDISRHRRIHTGEKPYRCEVCKKQFAQSSVLSRHRRIHTDQKPYSCNMCEKHFKAPSDLTKHKRIHVGQKPATCEICQKQLMGIDALTKHRRIHTGGKPHSCETCGKHFARTSDLVIHSRIHTGEKPYACDICKRQFARSYKLKEHARVHTTPEPGRRKTHAT